MWVIISGTSESFEWFVSNWNASSLCTDSMVCISKIINSSNVYDLLITAQILGYDQSSLLINLGMHPQNGSVRTICMYQLTPNVCLFCSTIPPMPLGMHQMRYFCSCSCFILTGKTAVPVRYTCLCKMLQALGIRVKTVWQGIRQGCKWFELELE